MFKYNQSDEFKTLIVRGRGRPTVMPNTLSSLYQGQLPVTEKKKTDLLKFCNTQVIPPEFHEWYKALPVDKKKKDDVAPEPSAFSSDSEENE